MGLHGADLLGLPLFPQGLLVAKVMEARGRRGQLLYDEVVVEEPRRATKTTSIWSVLLGRCSRIPGYRIVTTAQDGTRAGQKMREHMEILERRGFEEQGRGELMWSNGRERILFANGSIIWTVAPKPGAFRSEAADVVLFDEAGEMDPEVGPALLAAALPLMDTREDPQVVVTGTPGTSRAGLLWESLERGRTHQPGVGIVDYSIGEDDVLVSYDPDGAKVLHEDVLVRVHPGIGTLTTLSRMRTRFERMQPAEFEREYGCRWPSDSTTGAIDVDVWDSLVVSPTQRPPRVGMAYDVAPDGRSASLSYAWRVEGVAYVELVAHRPGVSWLAKVAHQASVKYRREPIAYDNIGANLDPAQAMSRLKPPPRTSSLTLKETMAAAQRYASDIHDRRLHHFAQTDLDAAIDNLAWRDIAKSGRAFGAKDPHGPAINPVVSGSLALWSYDKGHDRQPISITV